MQILFAATHPERTTALVLMSTCARVLQAPDYPEGVSVEAFEMVLRRVEERWGEGTLLRTLAPAVADNPVKIVEYISSGVCQMSGGSSP